MEMDDKKFNIFNCTFYPEEYCLVQNRAIKARVAAMNKADLGKPVEALAYDGKTLASFCKLCPVLKDRK